MVDPVTAEAPHDLFGGVPATRIRRRAPPRQTSSELAYARVLYARLRRKQPLPDKRRIAHLICLNLISMLDHGSRR